MLLEVPSRASEGHLLLRVRLAVRIELRGRIRVP